MAKNHEITHKCILFDKRDLPGAILAMSRSAITSKFKTCMLVTVRPFSIVLVKLALNATRNSRKKPKNAKVMPDLL